MKNKLALSLLITALCLLAVTAMAQTQLGQISGKVTDPGGAVIVGAKVTVTNLGSQLTQAVQSNSEGLFAVGNVPIGEYEITVQKEGFKRAALRAKVEVAQSVYTPFILEIGAVSETVEVSGSAIIVNTTTGEVSREVTAGEIGSMPLLTRNPYNLVGLAPGAVDTGNATGDAYGVGYAVGGARTRSINFLLDGSENNETFSTGPSTIVPVDAIQEFKVQSNSMTAEFGRNALQANVVTRSGSNSFHGSASEFYRGAALSTLPVEDAVNNTPKSNYVRNVFGASVGGPIKKDSTFFFGSMEGTRVRSTGKNFYYVPTQDFFNNSSANMQAYLQAGGGLPKPLLSDVITASDLAALEGVSGLTSATGTPLPASTPLFQRTYDSVPIDAGGGTAQNTWSVIGKVDHKLTDSTNLMARYAWYRQEYPTGAGADSPFSQFNVPYTFRSQNATIGITHTFSPVLFNESRIAYSRTQPQTPLGKGDVNVMCLQYGLSGSLGTGDAMVFPGYLPAQCSGFAIPSGGPQNTYSGYTSFTWSKGRNIFKWGAYARHLRDNHTFGAFENAYASSSAMQNLLDGQIDSVIQLGIDPKGLVPGELYDASVLGPLGPPSFTRHYHYNETALYFQDQIKLTSRVTMTAGVRWEYFGVLHSPDGERFLDANLYLDAAGSAAALTPGKTIFDQIRDARFQRTNNFFNQNWKNFAPRVGVAWDVFGNQRTVFRAGYGMFYDANFGNALFNAIQNPPNYAVVSLFGDGVTPLGPVLPNQYQSLAALLGGGSFKISSSARMLNRDMRTAYSQEWNATVEHDLLGKGIFASVGYVGSKGDKLYSLNNLNQRGSCIMLGESWCASPLSRLNQTGLTGMNRRANEGFSRYDSLQVELRGREIPHTGLQLAAAYGFAHSKDNESSFFNDSAFDTNGDFGFKNPYNPAADYADSSNDIRHRFTMSYTWQVPWTKDYSGMKGQFLGGWGLAGILAAQTGGAFSVYEDNFGVYNDVCSLSSGDACYPVVTGSLPSQQQERTFVGPNRSVLYDFSNSFESLEQYCSGDLACTQQTYYFNQGVFAKRNTFRTPGYWNFDASILKDFKLPREGMKLQFRAEFFNLFNHSNLYADPNTNVLSAGQVLARRGVPPTKESFGAPPDRRNIQLGMILRF